MTFENCTLTLTYYIYNNALNKIYVLYCGSNCMYILYALYMAVNIVIMFYAYSTCICICLYYIVTTFRPGDMGLKVVHVFWYINKH